MRRSVARACALLLAAFCASARGADPVDPDLIPEARKVLDYLASVYGKKTLAGMSSYGGWRPVLEISGRMPAIYAVDAFGWNPPKWGPSYRNVLRDAVEESQRWWHDRGGIVSFQFHWGKPGDPKGSAWVGGDRGTGPVDVGKTVTPGTAEHRAAMDDLAKTADYLEELAKARVPVLWRPLHEIDGGWFWWTDKERPENTASLWRLIFDTYVKERGLHNLIWVYSAGLHPGGLKRGADPGAEIAFRKRFYPGDRYVDIAGIDIYPNSYYGWGRLEEDTYPRAFDLMAKVAPGKILALCESAGIPSPDLLEEKGPPWLYALPWFVGGQNPVPWIRATFRHERILTLDEIPALPAANIAPDVRIAGPEDGACIAGSTVAFEIDARDRNGNLGGVELFSLPGPWKNWSLRGEKDTQEALAKAKRIGEAKAAGGGRFTFVWEGAPAGLRDVAAVARDADGAKAMSNVVRLAVGLENLARGSEVRASSDPEGAAQTIDGDLFTTWSGAKEGPQWLALDLGSPRRVGAVVASWWKAYAKAYRVQVSADGTDWKEAGRIEGKRIWHGDADVIRFAPVEARHVRILATERGADWGGYALQELAVFAAVPE
ncbi:MAG: discoidin domain-containing protein [Planctomycetes bacterium]|nr:discoidin domain-containing protein [Planctomycetota bacterium]